MDPTLLRSRLLDFFDAHARDLPWRRTGDPYAIWVSEVMLQQTRVDTVVPYFERWMERYPDVPALADASLDDVLKAWEGLGYYRRARMLHRAAAVVRDRHAGAVPSTLDALRELPGVGEYTAGAVASIAYGEAVPAVDGNVRRVLARLFDLRRPSPADVRERGALLVDPDRPGDFNQALMELGATVCAPRSPRCSECPVAELCRARAAGTQESRPLPADRRTPPRVEMGVAVPLLRTHGGGRRLFLVRRPEEGLLGGLWEFPGEEVGEGEDATAAAGRAAARCGRPVEPVASPLPRVDHVFSHLRVSYRAMVFEAGKGATGAPDPAGGWFDARGVEELALPVAQRRLAELARDFFEAP